jgi:uncharacterized RDD family membrane protein YckC
MGEADHRCSHCGRTPDDTLMPSVVRGSVAPKLHRAPPDAQPAVGGQPMPTAPPAPIKPGPQSHLFPDDGVAKIIPFPVRRQPASKPRVRHPRPVPEEQGNFDFRPAPKAKAKTLSGTTVDAAIHCDERPAARVHRSVAAAFDLSMVIIACVFFLMLFLLAGGSVPANKNGLLALAGALALVAAAYSVLPVVAGRESLGMRLAGLRVITFRGFPPNSKQRWFRFFGSILSSCIVVGLIWSFWDEESLTWQDHISGTFPTALSTGKRVFHRR